uniref:DNA2/NAM7 helicase helicase domain-containing protein n=1 Tax=Meloidogyne javanica TaxID=6303 RepID=A0A915MJM6_MELJA
MFACEDENPPNNEQLQAIDLTLNPTPSVIVTLAPPGTGKSRIVAMMALQLMKNGKTPMIIAHSNLAMSKIVEYICPELSKINKTALILLSARAKEQYMDLFEDFKEHLLIASLKEIEIESLGNKDKRTALRYKEKAFTKPKMADEKSTAMIVLEADNKPSTNQTTPPGTQPTPSTGPQHKPTPGTQPNPTTGPLPKPTTGSTPTTNKPTPDPQPKQHPIQQQQPPLPQFKNKQQFQHQQQSKPVHEPTMPPPKRPYMPSASSNPHMRQHNQTPQLKS